MRRSALLRRGLGPAVGVHVGVESVLNIAVKMSSAAESGLGKHRLHGDAFGVVGPVFEEKELAFAEEFETGNVDHFGIIVGVANVVGARAFHGVATFGSGFEFAVLQDGKVDAAEDEVGVVDADALLDGSGVVGIGKVPTLLALHHFDIFGMKKITAVIAFRSQRFFAAFAPEVALPDVVVVGDGDAGAVAKEFSKGETELEPRGGVLLVIVGLVAGEKDEVGILGGDVAGVFFSQAAVFVRIAGEGGEHDFRFLDGVLANESLVGRSFAVAETVFGVFAHVPILNAEAARPAEIVDLLFGDFDPLPSRLSSSRTVRVSLG